MKKIFVLFLIFFGLPTHAIMLGNDISMCGAYKYDKIYAVFTQDSYTCNAGYFLPAASGTCAACPYGHSCPGGTFHYNAREHQGLQKTPAYVYTQNSDINNVCSANYVHRMYAVFTPNQIEIIWQDAAQSDVTANDARYVTYGTDIRTPANPPPHIPGKVFTGWKFIPAQ